MRGFSLRVVCPWPLLRVYFRTITSFSGLLGLSISTDLKFLFRLQYSKIDFVVYYQILEKLFG